MSSKSISITDFNAAIDDGTIPGKFSDDRAIFYFDTVESVNTRGATLVWNLEVRLYDTDAKLHPFDKEFLGPSSTTPEGFYGYIITKSHQISAKGVEGKVRAGVKPTLVKVGKNLGRSNATNPATQALRDALSKYNGAKKKASNATGKPAVDKSTTDKIGTASDSHRPPPMLVKKINETVDATLTPDDFDQGLTVQRKFNGTRSPAHLFDGKTDMYSRTNRDHLGLLQIRAELDPSLADAPLVPEKFILSQLSQNTEATSKDFEKIKALYNPENLFLDGELYLHGKSLRWISGQARKETDDGTLNYVVYDCFFPAAIAAGYQMISQHRQQYLDMFFNNANDVVDGLKHVQRAENFKVSNLGDVYKLRDQFLTEGYEGAIVRKNWTGYRYGGNNYHSSNLVKVKPMFDSEFKVVGYDQGTKGKDVGALIWVCEVELEHVKDENDKTFSVVPKNMTYAERYRIFGLLNAETFEKYIKGKLLTIEFPERSSKTGKPTQAKALQFRVEEGDDPITMLYSLP